MSYYRGAICSIIQEHLEKIGWNNILYIFCGLTKGLSNIANFTCSVFDMFGLYFSILNLQKQKNLYITVIDYNF